MAVSQHSNLYCNQYNPFWPCAEDLNSLNVIVQMFQVNGMFRSIKMDRMDQVKLACRLVA
jgi:hypothetical protein